MFVALVIWRGPRPMLDRLQPQADELERLRVDIDTTDVVP